MIALISGKVVHKGITHVIVDTHGVGYRVFIPLTTFYELPDTGQNITLHVYTHVKQDGINLFGFYTPQEKDVFELMLGVSGIGPKMSLNILSGISVQELLKAISDGDVKKLVSIPGLGKKTAERLILELKEKIIKKIAAEETAPGMEKQISRDMIREDVLSALINLGYKNSIAQQALERVMNDEHQEMAMDKILKKTLKILWG
ncbi:MAG TPA: Holliday junction branch migration protein RuvA [Smithellaceae bacterium]|nr:Holliday junction branch migration protein RuvA [Smithellaceae bacterium]HRS88682.1 Holliday junction branch migration protein RuvA [Smithellaceae bacterium]HRV26752.1 Holliday junction branch migration protein RuvA [Smithellaceae bacterium]